MTKNAAVAPRPTFNGGGLFQIDTPSIPYLIPAIITASIAFHLSFFSALNFVNLKPAEQIPNNNVIKISESIPKIKEPPIVKEEIKKEEIKPPTRKARVRSDEKAPPLAKNAPPPELRAGLSNSTSLQTGAGIAIAQGNSAEVVVDPQKANEPLPQPVSVPQNEVDLNVPVAEVAQDAMADTPTSCPIPKGLELSEDALNAGLSSGEVVVEFFVGADGVVKNPILKKRTGYTVDKTVLEAVQKIKCSPAKVKGQAVAVKASRIKFMILAQ